MNDNDDWMPDFIKKPRVDPEEEINKVLAALPCDHRALELGQAIYRCRSLSWDQRWRVAKECLKYETPTLGVVASNRFCRALRSTVEEDRRNETDRSEAFK